MLFYLLQGLGELLFTLVGGLLPHAMLDGLCRAVAEFTTRPSA